MKTKTTRFELDNLRVEVAEIQNTVVRAHTSCRVTVEDRELGFVSSVWLEEAGSIVQLADALEEYIDMRGLRKEVLGDGR